MENYCFLCGDFAHSGKKKVSLALPEFEYETKKKLYICKDCKRDYNGKQILINID